MAKQPVTTPRWLQLASHGALIITIVAAVVSYGRSSQRTADALASVKELPQLQAKQSSTDTKLIEIKELIEKQGVERQKDVETAARRMDGLQEQITALGQLDAKVSAITGQMGSVWALEQSNSNSVHELKGTLNAILQQQQPKK